MLIIACTTVPVQPLYRIVEEYYLAFAGHLAEHDRMDAGCSNAWSSCRGQGSAGLLHREFED